LSALASWHLCATPFMRLPRLLLTLAAALACGLLLHVATTSSVDPGSGWYSRSPPGAVAPSHDPPHRSVSPRRLGAFRIAWRVAQQGADWVEGLLDQVQAKNRIIVALFGLIMLLSLVFELGHGLLVGYLKKKKMQLYLKMMQATMKELTILGFVGLTLMCLVKSGALTQINDRLFGSHGHTDRDHHHRVLFTGMPQVSLSTTPPSPGSAGFPYASGESVAGFGASKPGLYGSMHPSPWASVDTGGSSGADDDTNPPDGVRYEGFVPGGVDGFVPGSPSPAPPPPEFMNTDNITNPQTYKVTAEMTVAMTGQAASKILRDSATLSMARRAFGQALQSQLDVAVEVISLSAKRRLAFAAPEWDEERPEMMVVRYEAIVPTRAAAEALATQERGLIAATFGPKLRTALIANDPSLADLSVQSVFTIHPSIGPGPPIAVVGHDLRPRPATTTIRPLSPQPGSGPDLGAASGGAVAPVPSFHTAEHTEQQPGAHSSHEHEEGHEGHRAEKHKDHQPTAGHEVHSELAVLFEEVHLLVFVVMICFILLVILLLRAARSQHHIFAQGELSRQLELIERLERGPGMWEAWHLEHLIQYRIVRREFFHPSVGNPHRRVRGAGFKFDLYLAQCMTDCVIDLIEIPPGNFIAFFVAGCLCEPALRLHGIVLRYFIAALQYLQCGAQLAILMHLRWLFSMCLPEEYPTMWHVPKHFSPDRTRPQFYDLPLLRSDSRLSKWLRGTASPSKHEGMFVGWKNGRRYLAQLIQFALFMQAVQLTINIWFVGEEVTHHHYVSVGLQFPPTVLMWAYIWPNIIFFFTISTSTGQMKHEEHIEQVCSAIASDQFRRYSALLSEMYTRAATYSITEMRRESRKNYTAWYQSKLAQFDDLPHEEAEEIVNCFKVYDKSANGMIDHAELVQCLTSMGMAEPVEVADLWFIDIFDLKDGELSREDFYVLMVVTQNLHTVVDDGDFMEWFQNKVDTRQDGYIGVDDFMDNLPKVCEHLKIDEEYVMEMFQVVENSQDEDLVVEEVSVTKFVNWINRLVRGADTGMAVSMLG